jgi:hypothetical protein
MVHTLEICSLESRTPEPSGRGWGMYLSVRRYREETFESDDSWWTCADPQIRCNRILDGDVLPSRVLLEGSEQRAVFRCPPDVSDNTILKALHQTPLASMRELAKSMCISRAIVGRRLTGSLGFTVKHLHWPRYPPDRCAIRKSNQSIKRIAQTLRVGTGQWLAKFITWDEPWLYLCTSHEKGWVEPGQQPPEIMTHMISRSTL